MTRPPDRDPPRDPLYFDAPLRHVVTLPVLGVPVRFESNTSRGIAAAEEAFGAWRALGDAHPRLVARTGARVRIVVHEGDDPKDAPVKFRMPANDVLVMHTPGSVALVLAARREAVAYVTESLLADPMQVHHRLLPGITLSLVIHCDRAPVHAAVVARGDTALILAGPPGTGKSTLAYQAARAGLRVLGDDAAYVQTDPDLLIWGATGRSLLMPDAPAWFPELASHEPRVVADGTRKIVVEYPDAWPGAAPVAARAVVCLLERDGVSAAVARRRVDGAEVRQFLKQDVGLTAAILGPALDAALQRLVPESGWKLSLSSNPSDALPHLEALLELHGASRSYL